ncbi:MAG: hypothetical protein PHH77_07245 [Victivallaceae bacterium]|nr:hypothetical protein [Victivallaceae bacterium]
MLHKIFFDENGIVNEILKNMGFQTGEKEPSIEDVPFYRGVKNRINELGVFEENARLERKVLSHLLNYIDEACKEPTKPEKPEAPNEPEKAQAPESANEPEIPAEAKVLEPPVPEKTATPELPPVDSANPRLRVLEDGVKDAIENLEAAPLTEHFKDVKRICELLKLACKPAPELTEMERLAKLEAAIGEAHSFLQNSRLATRFNVLKDVKKILEDAMDKKAQV